MTGLPVIFFFPPCKRYYIIKISMVNISLKPSGFAVVAALYRTNLEHIRGNECTVTVFSVEDNAKILLYTQAAGTALEN